MSLVIRAYRTCVWCRTSLGYTRREYCNAACKQKAYRYRRRGNREARPYGRQVDSQDEQT